MVKDKPGPEKQFTEIFRLRMDGKLLRRIERYAREKKLMTRGKPNRSEAIRQILDKALRSKGL